MSPENNQNRIHKISGIFRKTAETGMTMRLRLFVFLAVFVVIMVLSSIATLLVADPFKSGKGEAERFIGKEFSELHHALTSRCGDASAQLIQLSRALSVSIENRLLDSNIRIGDLKKHPEVLEDVIGNELGSLQLALERTKCSGVFMVLDATVGPTLPGAENSRAGICIRYVEPELPGPDMTRRYVRGFPGIAYQNGLAMAYNWDMEFDVTDRSFYHLPIEKYNETRLPLSRLTYWNFESILSGNGDSMLLCSVPLVSSNGEAFGVCGFEISETNFQSSFPPDGSEYRHIFCMLSLIDEDGLYPENAFFSGNHTAFSYTRDNGSLYITDGNGLSQYRPENGKPLLGLHEEIRLYPSDSAFTDWRFALSLLIPKEDLDALTFGRNMRLVIICALLLFLGVFASILISKKYLSPITKAFDTVRPDNIDDTAKTNILEIDLLIERIRAAHEKESPLSDNLFEDFISRVKTLTRTEAIVFRHYMEGRTGVDIKAQMGFSANTLKAHNKHIYAKLGVTSKTELILYVDMIKKSGMEPEIFQK